MASHTRPSLGANGLEDFHRPLPTTGEHLQPVEARQITYPETAMNEFPSLRPSRKEALRPYPLRLSPDQIAALEELKRERGVSPPEFIRDAINNALRLVNESEKKE